MRFAALGWSVALGTRLRDWRMGVLSALLAALALSPSLTLYTHVGALAPMLDQEHDVVHEIPGLLVSALALTFVWLLGRILASGRRESERLREIQESFRNNEARLRVMLEQLPAVVWTTDLELRLSSSVGAGLGDLGLKPGEAVGHTIHEFFTSQGKSHPAITAHLGALEGRSVAYEQDWSGHRYRSVVEPLRNAEGQVIGTLGVALDVTDLVASERALQQSKARYQDFLTQTSEGIWRVELAQPISTEVAEEEQIDHLYRYGELAECSDAFAKMFGLTSASVLVDARLDEILPRLDVDNLEHLRTFIRRDYKLVDAESTDLDELGRRHHYVNSLTGITEDGHLLRIWGVRRDVTAHRESDQALKASEEKYRELFEESRDTIFISTPEGRLIDINPAGVKLLGYSSKKELLNVSVESDLYSDPEKRDQVVEMLHEHGGCRDFELRLKRKNGSEIVVLETASVVRNSEDRVVAFRGVLRDVSRQRQLEEQLQGAQRMEAVGRLAGGVAHDFNNLLTVINGRSDMLATLVEPDSNLMREIDEIKQAGQRAVALTRQLLLLSRRQVGSPQALCLNRVIGAVENLLRRSIGEQIELVTNLDSDLPSVLADESQIEQVLLNLALNARDAMATGGTLTLETTKVLVDESSAAQSLALDEGPYVLLRVRDTGDGIDPLIRGKLFEPFVTTKESSRGTGLGLSTVYGVVKQCKGQIRVESQPGRGASFEIYLPAVDQPAVATAEDVEVSDVPTGKERILLVEDEAAVRSLLRRFLDSQGYRVVEASNGDAALDLAETNNGGFDLLLTDLVMPGMGGFELAKRLEQHLPGLHVIFMSGYSEEAVRDPEAESTMTAENFLQKPFSTDLLARRLRDVLDPQ
jgi:PAS domain S-box-containing protein